MKNNQSFPPATNDRFVAGWTSLQFLKKVILESPVPILVLDKQRRVIVWNNACENLTGLAAAAVLETQEAWRGFYSEEKTIIAELVLEEETSVLAQEYKGIWFSKTAPGGVEAEGWFPALNGKNRYLVLSAAPIRSERGEIIASIEIINDITERKVYEQQLAADLTHDPLTGLPNRSLLVDRLQQALHDAKRNEGYLAVYCVSLDRFDSVAQGLDPKTTALVLNTISQRLQFEIRAIDTVAYFGQGEFVIIASRFQREEYIAGLAHRIDTAVASPIFQADERLSLTCTVGISAFPTDGEEHNRLLENANAALVQAKNLCQGSLRFFSPELNAKYMTRLNIEFQLKNALPNQEFSLHYQPKVSLKTGRMTGMEALLRWTNKQLGSVGPAVFIPLAERLGLVEGIGNWVFETACEQLVAWQGEGLSPPPVSINLSGRQLRNPKFIRLAKQVLARTGINAHCLELEVTETAVVGNLSSATKLLTELKSLGVSISLDDFGTGYSSLSYLRQLPIDKIKIDRSFITEIISDPSSAAITRATIAMAHALQIKVIAEGVEDQEQLAFLQRLGCDEIQGYFYSRPVPAGEFAALLQNRPTLRLGATEHDAAQRVLIVDDEPAILSSLKRELSLNGFEVETAANAEEGFSILARQLIPVVISDFNMPGLSGPDFLERVKKLHPQTVRVAISGAHDLELMARAINKGSVFKFIFKPWTEEQLIDIMEESFRYYHASANLAGEGI